MERNAKQLMLDSKRHRNGRGVRWRRCCIEMADHLHSAALSLSQRRGLSSLPSTSYHSGRPLATFSSRKKIYTSKRQKPCKGCGSEDYESLARLLFFLKRRETPRDPAGDGPPAFKMCKGNTKPDPLGSCGRLILGGLHSYGSESTLPTKRGHTAWRRVQRAL